MITRRLPTVRDFMDRYVETISPGMDIMAAVDFLLEKRVTGALVANAEKELVGILSEFDCLKLLTLGDAARHEIPKGKVRDFMNTDVQTIPPTMDIYYCAGLFMNVAFRRFPVVEGQRIVGAITRFDLLRAVRQSLMPYRVDSLLPDVP
ncbi:MAG: CBS domain-containing protein [Rhodospirillaceae bacterium]